MDENLKLLQRLADCAGMEAEFLDLKRDAERYRWLRHGEKLDAVIDAGIEHDAKVAWLQKGVAVELAYTSEDKPIRTARAGELRGPHSLQEPEGMTSATDHPVAGSTPAHTSLQPNAEIANLIAERDHLLRVIEFIGTAAGGGAELFPVGPTDTEYAPDGNTVLRHIGPWRFQYSQGATFMEAVETEMKKA